MDMAGLMTGLNVPFRPDSSAAHSHMSFDQSQAQQKSTLTGVMIAPAELMGSNADVNGLYGNAYSNPYDLAPNYSNATFGTLAWPVSIPLDHAGMPPPSMLRNESYSSTDSSEPYIKTEEASPVHPSQVFFDANAYASSPDSQTATDSSDESSRLCSLPTSTLSCVPSKHKADLPSNDTGTNT